MPWLDFIGQQEKTNKQTLLYILTISTTQKLYPKCEYPGMNVEILLYTGYAFVNLAKKLLKHSAQTTLANMT